MPVGDKEQLEPGERASASSQAVLDSSLAATPPRAVAGWPHAAGRLRAQRPAPRSTHAPLGGRRQDFYETVRHRGQGKTAAVRGIVF